MATKNRDHLAVYPYLNTSWVFVIHSDVQTYSEITDGTLDVCASLFESFNDFIYPTSIEYNVAFYRSDYNYSMDDPLPDPVTVTTKNVQSDSGIAYSTFSSSVPRAGQNVRMINSVNFYDNKVLTRLEDGDVLTSKDQYCKSYRHEEDPKDDPSVDPIVIDVQHGPLTKNPDETAYYVDVGVQSDIWFGDSAISKANQQYLSSFLQRVHHNTSADNIRRESETYAESILERIY